jgi:hypothetical protein
MKPAGCIPTEQMWREVLSLARNDPSRVGLVCKKADDERLLWGISWEGVRYEVNEHVVLRQAQRVGMLRPAEVRVLLDCEMHACGHEGVFPREIMLEAGENDRFDHVRQREASLARDAQKAAVRVATVVLGDWQRRSKDEWLALSERIDVSVGQRTELDVIHVEEECAGVTDGFGVASSAAVAVDIPDDDLVSDDEEAEQGEEEDHGALLGRGDMQTDESSIPLDDHTLSEDPTGREANLVRDALERALEGFKAGGRGYDDLSAEILVEKVSELLGRY